MRNSLETQYRITFPHCGGVRVKAVAVFNRLKTTEGRIMLFQELRNNAKSLKYNDEWGGGRGDEIR